jgi:hypothetical protein
MALSCVLLVTEYCCHLELLCGIDWQTENPHLSYLCGSIHATWSSESTESWRIYIRLTCVGVFLIRLTCVGVFLPPGALNWLTVRESTSVLPVWEYSCYLELWIDWQSGNPHPSYLCGSIPATWSSSVESAHRRRIRFQIHIYLVCLPKYVCLVSGSSFRHLIHSRRIVYGEAPIKYCYK